MPNVEYVTIPDDFVYGQAYDTDQHVPFSLPFDDFAVTELHKQTEPGFNEALYPGSWEEFVSSLSPTHQYDSTYGMACAGEELEMFDGLKVTTWTGQNWLIPTCFVTGYIVLMVVLKLFMKNREPMKLRRIKVLWNFGLSAFSITGLCILGHSLLFHEYAGVFTAGLEASICTHASFYGGCGWSGVFAAAFCYSKLFELVDTVWLILAKRPVIFLHWYHHITVLLFCWYAYATRASTAAWFSTVNYGIHSIMYFYYGMTQYSPYCRSLVKPFAMSITFLQTAQMAWGLIITGFTVYYRYYRKTCYTHPNVNMFGLVMYLSYFVLFLQIFISRYWCKSKKMDSDAMKKKKS